MPITIGGSEGITRDLNAAGVYLETSAAFAVGDPISLEIEIPHPLVRVQCEGTVVRVDPLEDRLGIAVRIDSVDF